MADQTFEDILERMLDRVPDELDKREGSVIYDALAPAAAELAQLYMEIELNANLFFADTANGEYLDRSIAWSGIARKPASPAELQGRFYNEAGEAMDVPLGSRFSADTINYSAAEKLGAGSYRLICETAGAAGSRSSGTLLPIDYIPRLARAEIATLLIPGVETEGDETLRQRYFNAARKPATSGNKAHYEEWALKVSGVGSARIFPLWDGPKTVKVVIADADKRPASAVLVEDVQQYIDPAPGLGEGQAPVGAVVTVSSVQGKTVTVSAKVALAAGYSIGQAATAFQLALEAYRKERGYASAYLSQSVIGALLLATEGVVDYSELKLNGAASNVALGAEEVPIFGDAVLEVQNG
ncbi:Baseplate J-like protein [compost metagenome]